LGDSVGLALPSFESYRAAHSKAGFSRLLDQLGLPQPATRIVKSEGELRDAIRFPSVVKTSAGTASHGIWLVRDHGDLEDALQDLSTKDAFAERGAGAGFRRGHDREGTGGVLPQQIGFHAYRQIAAGAGGGEAIKQSVRRPEVRAHVATISEKLAWHGALSVDYVLPDDGVSPFLIDCNSRLVEPMSAYLAGVDLVALLLQVSQGETPAPAPESREGVRTHLAMQVLLGCASRGGTRLDIVRECWHLVTGGGPCSDSAEEMTPVRLDWISAVPLVMIAVVLLAAPKLGVTLARGGWGAHLLDVRNHRERRLPLARLYSG
jgi:hypothetical protein